MMRKTMLVVAAAALCTASTVVAVVTQALDVVGEALKGPAVARVIITSAPDGYRVAYAVAELDAAFTEDPAGQ